jgi:hypothetical protein
MTESGGVLVCLHHPIDEDPTLAELADLPLGWYAERDSADEPWHRFENQTEDDAADSTNSGEDNRIPEAES